MQWGALRTEFVLSGFAFLAALAALLESLHIHAIAWAGSEHLNTISVGGFGVLVAAAYIAGIAIVQITFFFPTQGMIAAVRNSRFADLAMLDEHFRAEPSQETAHGGLEVLRLAFSGSADWTAYTWRLPGRRWANNRKNSAQLTRRYWMLIDTADPADELPPDTRIRRHSQTLALTMGRAFAQPEVAGEYKYRRANRQVFVGMLPSAAIAGAAGTIALGRSSAIFIPSMIIATLIILRILIASAAYQERISQSMIVDVAFLRRWDAGASASAGSEAE